MDSPRMLFITDGQNDPKVYKETLKGSQGELIQRLKKKDFQEEEAKEREKIEIILNRDERNLVLHEHNKNSDK